MRGMKVDEAILRIKYHNEFHSRQENPFAVRITEALNIAVKALEKQIPKQIEEQTEEDREFIDYVCPNCKTTLQQKMKGATRTTIYKYKHCIFCGQALDWSDHPTEKGGGQE